MNRDPQRPGAAGGCGRGKRFGLGDLWSRDPETRERARLSELREYQLLAELDTCTPFTERLIHQELAWRQRNSRAVVDRWAAEGGW
jgi:hypothetical protein